MRPVTLGIMIPTYNRATYLDKLLSVLICEIKGIEKFVTIIVSNNASTDQTLEVVESYRHRIKNLKLLNNETNIGPDENFCKCIENDSSDYIWLLGDDDLPRSGLIRLLYEELKQKSPDVVSMKDYWAPSFISNNDIGNLSSLGCINVSKLTFSKIVNARVTFMSVFVLKRSLYIENATSSELRKFTGSNLIHLGWVLPTIKLARSFCYVPKKCILATSGNTGGYSVLKVFAQNFLEILQNEFGAKSEIYKAVKFRTIVRIIPTIVWNLRIGSAGFFSDFEKSDTITNKSVMGSAAYKLIVSVINGNFVSAYTIKVVCSIVYFYTHTKDQFYSRFENFKNERTYI